MPVTAGRLLSATLKDQDGYHRRRTDGPEPWFVTVRRHTGRPRINRSSPLPSEPEEPIMAVTNGNPAEVGRGASAAGGNEPMTSQRAHSAFRRFAHYASRDAVLCGRRSRPFTRPRNDPAPQQGGPLRQGPCPPELSIAVKANLPVRRTRQRAMPIPAGNGSAGRRRLT